jgi:tetratricopeptide (TPR) repeat protein
MRIAAVRALFALAALLVGTWSVSLSQDKDKDKKDAPIPGSIVEDRTARKLLEAGDARLEANETAKAVEVWQSVLERYPRSKVRHEASMRLGNHYLERERGYDRARGYFETVAADDNPDEAQRAAATLKIGVCYYESRNFGKCFKLMREVIEKYPVSPQVNQAYYYIGLGHFQQGHYSRAIAALEHVGTALAGEDKNTEKLESGKRLFIRIDDADLAALETGKTVPVQLEAASGDKETAQCHPIGRNVRVVLGSIPTVLGKPKAGNGVLEIRGGDQVKISYADEQTLEGNVAKLVAKDVPVVGNAIVAIMDGAYAETLSGVVLGRGVNLQIVDADFDRTDNADILKAVVEVYREKTQEELNAEGNQPAKTDASKLDRYKKIDRVETILTEVKLAREQTASPALEDDAKIDEKKAAPKKDAAATRERDGPEPEDDSVHSGMFRAVVQLAKAEAVIADDAILQAQPNDLVIVTYVDDRNSGGEARTLTFRARCVEGSLGGVRVTQTQISDQELRVKTQLKTASALTNIGNRYKEFGLKSHADAKYQQALKICEEISDDARKLGGRTLEETYVQLWKIYFEMDNLNLAAAMSQRLQREFPNSEFVDAALLSLAQVARAQNQYQRAIGIYGNLLAMQKSPLRGEAQYGIAECYEEMAKNATEAAATQLFDRSFQEYKKVYDQFPDSGRVGEAVAKMANYYYQQKDYARAIDTFERVLQAQPDAKFLDVILFNYGRCLYRMERRADARKQFDHLIQDFPESALAADAKKISEALRKAGF